MGAKDFAWSLAKVAICVAGFAAILAFAVTLAALVAA